MPRIYVASLSDYVAGRLHGRWIDLDGMDLDGVVEAVSDMLSTASEPAEEWAIHDHEGFGDYQVSEYESLETVVKVAAAIDEHGEAFTHWLANEPSDVDRAIDTFDDAYLGERSALDYAYYYVEECVFDQETPEILKTYFDYEQFARDLVIGGDVFESGPHLFNGNM